MTHTLSKNRTVSILMSQQEREKLLKLLWRALWKEPVFMIGVILICSALNTLLVVFVSSSVPCRHIMYLILGKELMLSKYHCCYQQRF
jgi:hypothetical protein